MLHQDVQTESVREEQLGMSAATMDHTPKTGCKRLRFQGISITKPDTLLHTAIKIPKAARG